MRASPCCVRGFSEAVQSTTEKLQKIKYMLPCFKERELGEKVVAAPRSPPRMTQLSLGQTWFCGADPRGCWGAEGRSFTQRQCSHAHPGDLACSKCTSRLREPGVLRVGKEKLVCIILKKQAAGRQLSLQ